MNRLLVGNGRWRRGSLLSTRRSGEDEATLRIGGVEATIESGAKGAELPRGYAPAALRRGAGVGGGSLGDERYVRAHLQWMMQKDALGQDMFLLVEPGPFGRRLCAAYCEATRRSWSYLLLSGDTTEADLKQRRELADQTVVYHDAAPVQAAVEGRLLVLDGVHRVERNVLPSLNNLLENREMQLIDGRFLMSAARFDALLADQGLTAEQLRDRGFVRVHPRFRVVALGQPTPPYTGFALDPPLRSRFQARQATHYTLPLVDRFAELTALLPPERTDRRRIAEQLLAFAEGVAALATADGSLQVPRFPCVPYESLCRFARCLAASDRPGPALLHRFYPWRLLWTALSADEQRALLRPLQQLADASDDVDAEHDAALLPQRWLSSGDGLHWCLVGDKAAGKSHTSRQLFAALQQQCGGATALRQFSVYRDMSARDVLQRRVTDERGNTHWQNSPLVEAALAGHCLVLDGLHRLSPAAAAALRPLLHDRELVLPDGTLLLRHDRYAAVPPALRGPGVLPVHANFRLLALAEPPCRDSPWLTADLLNTFAFEQVRFVSAAQLRAVLQRDHAALAPAQLDALLRLYELTPQWQSGVDAAHQQHQHRHRHLITLRHVFRLARRLCHHPDDFFDSVCRAAMVPHMPPALRDSFVQFLASQCGIVEQAAAADDNEENKPVDIDDEALARRLGIDAAQRRRSVARPELVPAASNFYPMASQLRTLDSVVKDWRLGDKHVLLIGPQGTGKNKMADKLLQLARLEREYVQLHRDTTVPSLTATPTLEAGRIVYDDSPLIKAVKYGRVLVVDEADKAPLEVVCVLKAIVEDCHFLLPSGQQLGVDVPVHPDFRMLVLANKAGYPFLGNDLLRECGDVFSVHTVDNPDRQSELALLRSYAPDVPPDTRRRLVDAFARLRELVDHGTLAYPYSTRELVNVVRHLQRYPADSLAAALANVFDFDRYDAAVVAQLSAVMAEHGLALDRPTAQLNLLADAAPLPATAAACLPPLRRRLHAVQSPHTATVDDSAAKLSSAAHLFATVQTVDAAVAQHTEQLREQHAVWSLPCRGADLHLRCTGDGAVHVLARGTHAQLYSLLLPGQPGHLLQLLDLGFLDGAASKQLHLDALVGARLLCLSLLDRGLVYLLNPADVDATAVQYHLPAAFHGQPVAPHRPVRPAVVAEQRCLVVGLTDFYVVKRATGRSLYVDPSARRQLDLAPSPPLPLVDARPPALPDRPLLVFDDCRLLDWQQRTVARLQDASDDSSNADTVVVDALPDLRPLLNVDAGQRQRTVKISDGHGQQLLVQPHDAALLVLDPATNLIRRVQLADPDAPIVSFDFDTHTKFVYVVQSNGKLSSVRLFASQLADARTNWRDIVGSDPATDLTVTWNAAADELLRLDNANADIAEARMLAAQQSKAATSGLDGSPEYDALLEKVAMETSQLRVVLQGAEAKQRDRDWLPHQLDGEFDENKLVDSINGEKRVFRKRGKLPQQIGQQKAPKQLHFSFDMSNSMARGNQWDGRLDRQSQTMAMILAAFDGLDNKYALSMSAHAGAGILPLFEPGQPPRTPRARYQAIRRVIDGAGAASVGDNSLQAVQYGVDTVLREADADDYLVFVFTDARLGRYSITPAQIAAQLAVDPRVNAYLIMIAEPLAADWIAGSVSSGHAIACPYPQRLPQIIKNILVMSTID